MKKLSITEAVHGTKGKTMDIDYGPLTGLLGTWRGDQGLDVSPEPDGSELSPYYETILFEAADDATNAETQNLVVVRYHQAVFRKSNDEQFHDQTGYWMWDAESGVVMQSLTIPRAVCVLAGGTYAATDAADTKIVLEVAAKLGDDSWGIIQSPFMRDNARTVEFRHRITLQGDKLSYAETTFLDIYGNSFDHTDENVLKRN
jgi:hypothetical protein